jgi:hypothetical protein
MSLRDPRLGKLSRLFIDGVPLDLASELLPTTASQDEGSLVMHLRMHAKSQRRHERDENATGKERSFSENALRGLIESLRKDDRAPRAPQGRLSMGGLLR